MNNTPPGDVSPDDIGRFFAGRNIDAFCIADADSIMAPKGRHPHDLLPGCRTVILFGTFMTDSLFSGTDGERTEETRRTTAVLESAAIALRDRLMQSGSAAEAILPSFPLQVEEGRLQGLLSLKHCAADAGFGTIGENTLLIHPVYGNRLALAAVVIEQQIIPLPAPGVLPSCTHCHHCVTACPENAIQDGIVDQTRCRNLTVYVPRILRPLAWRLMRGRWSACFVIAFLNRVGTHLAISSPCVACMTACPHFNKKRW
jgi:epoxyqueuosine reductase